MATRRIDAPVIRRPRSTPMCRIFGEMRPHMGGKVRLSFWESETAHEEHVLCDSAAVATAFVERIRQAEMDAYEAFVTEYEREA